MIAFLVLIILVGILSYFEAKREDGMIAARPGGPDLDHKELVWRRLRNIGALVMVAVVFDGTEGWDALWMGLCHAGGAWAMFVLVHRLSLNLMRGQDWRYVSSGNKYDARFMRWTVALGNLSFLPVNKLVHRAGILACCVEIAVLALSIVCALLLLQW